MHSFSRWVQLSKYASGAWVREIRAWGGRALALKDEINFYDALGGELKDGR